jgi:hypothetical protein
VRAATLSPLLTNNFLHAVVALRHRTANAPTRALAVERARNYIGSPYSFAELGLVLLAPLALIRAYAYRLGKPAQPMLDWCAKQWWKLLQRRKRSRRVREFTCSAFVMACLNEAGLDVSVDSLKPGPEIIGTIHADRTEALAQLGESLSGGGEQWEMAAWRSLFTLDGQPAVTVGQALRAMTLLQKHPEAVSPGDLWRSASLFQAAIYLNLAAGQART